MSIVERILQRQQAILNEINRRNRKQNIRRSLQEGRAIYEWRIDPKTRQPYDFSQRRGRKEAVPFFGSSQGFGLDYVQTRSVPVSPVGYRGPQARVPVPIRTRRGNIAGISPARTYGPSESQETRRALSYQKTDQRVNPVRRSSGGSWDGKVRAGQKKPSYESNRKPRDKTEADKHAEDLKSWPFDFSV